MQDGGRLSAAIEILTEIIERHRPAREALKGLGNTTSVCWFLRPRNYWKFGIRFIKVQE